MIRSGQKGVSQIAVMVIMLILAIALPITTKLVQQRQENRSKAACDGGARVYFDGDSCQWGTTANCNTCNGGGENNCYGSMDGCTGAHPPSSSYPCDRCSSNYGCQRAVYDSSTSDCNSPIGSADYSVDCDCPERYGAGGGNDNACSSYCGGGDETYSCPSRCSSNYGCRRANAYESSTADCSQPIGSVDYDTDCNCPKRYGAGGGNDSICDSECGSGEPEPLYPSFNPNVTTSSNSLTISIRDGSNIHHAAIVDDDGKWVGNMTGAGHMWAYTVSGLSAGTYTYEVKACSIDSSSNGNVCPSTNLTVKSVTGTVGGGGVTPPVKTPTPSTKITVTPTKTPTKTPTPSTKITATPTKTPTPTNKITGTVTPTVTPTGGATGDTTVKIKLAFAGVKKNNGQCATNWLTALAMKNSSGNNVLDVTSLKVTPEQTDSVNNKGEIIYSFSATVTNVPKSETVSSLSFFLTGPKHVSLKFGKANQTSWFSDLVGDLSIVGGQNNEYDFSNFSLLVGDVTGDVAGTPDGKIDGRDFSYIKEKVNASTLITGSAGSNVDGDLDGNCQVNAGDLALIKNSLKEVNGQTY